MTNKPIVPIILCGGTGSRLWPSSRESYPKQYQSLLQDNKNSMLQLTQERITGLKNLNNPILICNEDHRFIAAEQMRKINIQPQSILLEPFGRNTAPAITIAALKAIESFSDPLLLILSADHEIKDTQKFQEIIEASLEEASKGRLVTFGIVPDSPETGFGYIEATKPLCKKTLEGSPIAQFIEKPNLQKAKQLISDQRYTWNSGMFLFKASSILEEIKKYAPEVLHCCQQAIDKNLTDLDFERLNKDAFKKCPNISIDIAVMEKTTKGTVFPLDAGWSDIGSWKALWDSGKKDNEGNIKIGKTITKSTRNCYLKSENRLLVGIGVQDLVIIETNDAVLIANKEHTQRVKEIVNELNEKGILEGKEHRRIYRPWGNYYSVVEGKSWKVKRIEVNPGQKLSLQMHYHRAEHWIIVTGTAKVEINNQEQVLTENTSAYIPLGAKHRLSNPGKMPLILIEVQSGSYLGEDDIVRFEDVYKRE